MRLIAFDFDGTITTKDTFILFIRFTRGSRYLYWAILANSLYLLAYKLRLYPNWKAKQRLFSFCFQGVSLEQFNKWCSNFSVEIERVVRPSMLEKVRGYQKEGAEVILVSASITDWIAPWARKRGISVVLATEIETNSGLSLTGKLKGRNCYGQEKVNRIVNTYSNRSSYTLVAYGDSRGDKEMLAFADEGWLLDKQQNLKRIEK